MKIKKIIAAVTALVLIGGAYPTLSSRNISTDVAFAAETAAASSVTEKGVRYNVYGDYAAAAEVNGELGCEIVIADEIGGKPVTAVEKGAFDAVKDKVKSVTLGSNIKAVNERSFYEFSELTTVKLGDAVDTIGNCAFAYCPKLESITFGKNLTTIDKCAFFSCPSLVSLEFPDSLTVIDDFAFEMCTGISKVKFGKNLQRLGNCAFKDSSNITEADLGENIESIGSAVFSGENLRCLVIPEKVTKVGQLGCPLYFKFSLKNRDTAIVIKNPECTIINDYVPSYSEYQGDYSQCVIVSADDSASRKTAEKEGLRYCTIEDYEKGNYERLTSISDLIESYGMTFENNETGLTLTGASNVGSGNSKVVIPDAVDGVPVTAIGKEAFKGTEIQYVYFGENITEVGESAFEGCPILYMAVLNDGLKTIGKSAFSGCTNIKEIVAGDNIETIGEKAFFRCSYIEGFKLTDNVKSIGRGAFGRTRIREMDIPASITELKGCPFESTDPKYDKPEGVEYIVDVKIMNPECKLSYCDSADEWKDCTIISDDGEAQTFAKVYSIRHCTSEEYANHDYVEYRLSDFGDSALRQYGMRFTKTEDGAELTDVIIPEDGVIDIPDEVETIPVTSISPYLMEKVHVIDGKYAVKKIKIGKNVKSIPKELCIRLSNLRIVDIGDGVENIEESAFEYCENLSSVSFGKNIKEIGESAFADCRKLQSTIDLPNVVSIGNKAFFDCGYVKGIDLGNSLKEIGDESFFGNCENKIIDLPDSLESIGKSAFCHSYALEEVNFGSGLKTIGDYAFSNNSLLKKAVLNEGLTELGKGAFENCYLLSEVSIPTTLTEIKESTFDFTSIKSLELPKNIKSVEKNAYCSLYRTEKNQSAEEDSYGRMITLPLLEDEVSIKLLNPDCEIAKNAFTGTYTAMYGYKDSTAEKYMADRKESDKFIALTDEPTEYLAGDTNCDGTVDLADAVLIMQALANPNRFGLNGTSDKRITEQGWENGDVDQRTKGITVNDAQKIQSYLLGKIKSFD